MSKPNTKKTKAPTPKAAAQIKPAKTAKPKTAATPSGGKLGAVIGLLQKPEGATIPILMAATGWQAHSVRGALAGSVKKKGHAVTSEKTETGRVYRIAEPAA